MKLFVKSVFAFSLVAFATSAASAAFTGLGPAGNYNVYVLGNNTQHNSDIGGTGPSVPMGIAVGGNFQTTGHTVAGNVIVRGNFTNSNHSVGGNIIAGSVNYVNPTVFGSVNSQSYVDFNGGGGSVAGGINYVTTYAGPNYFPNRNQVLPSAVTFPFDFDAANAHVQTLSTVIASLPTTPGATATGGNNSQLLLTGSGSDQYVFRINSSQLANMNDFSLNVSGVTGTPTVIIDVVNDQGGALTIHNNGISLNGTDTHHVLFNLANTTSLNTNNIGIRGSMLAPFAAVNFNSGNIDGTLVAGSLFGTGEAHAHAYLGWLPPVPEPTTAVVGLGFAGLMARRRR